MMIRRLFSVNNFLNHSGYRHRLKTFSAQVMQAGDQLLRVFEEAFIDRSLHQPAGIKKLITGVIV